MKVNTAMALAFANVKVNSQIVESHGNIVKAAVNSLESGKGTRNVRDWNAHLKFGTYNKLKKVGVM